MSERNKSADKIKSLTKDEIIKLIEKSESSSDILRNLEISVNAYYLNLIRFTIRSHGLTPPFNPTLSNFAKQKLKDILVENSTFSGNDLKKRLLKEGLLINECQECGIGPEWNGKALSLQMDHINGINNDHRIENLRILCPNCHSQTDTFCGKRFKNLRRCICGSYIYGDFDKCDECEELLGDRKEISHNKTERCKCGEFKSRNTNLCISCNGKEKQKFSPTKEDLEKLIFQENQTLVQLGKKYGVSDNAVKKRCIGLGIDLSLKNKKAMQEKYRIIANEEASDSDIIIKFKDTEITRKELKKLLFEDNMSYMALGRKFNATVGTIKYKCKMSGIDLSMKCVNNKNNKSDNEIESDTESNISIKEQQDMSSESEELPEKELKDISDSEEQQKVTKKKYTKECACGNIIGKYTTQCNECKYKKNQRYDTTKEEMENLLFMENMSYAEIGRKYGVKGDSVKKRCISLGIDLSEKITRFTKKEPKDISDSEKQIKVIRKNIAYKQIKDPTDKSDSSYYLPLDFESHLDHKPKYVRKFYDP